MLILKYVIYNVYFSCVQASSVFNFGATKSLGGIIGWNQSQLESVFKNADAWVA